MSCTDSNHFPPISNRDKRIQLRNGIKLVLEDRIEQANRTGNIDPVLATLNRIHFNQSYGFKVSIMLEGFVVIDDTVYLGNDNVMLVRDGKELLFTIYQSKKDGMFSMVSDDLNLMCETEKEFHMGISKLLEELRMEEYDSEDDC